MSSNEPSPSLLLLLVVLLLSWTLCRGDPEPVQDFCVAAPHGSGELAFPGLPCKPSSSVVSDDFFFAAHARGASTDNAMGSGVTPGNVEAFPGLNTLGVSINRVDLAPGGVNPLHSHPRAAELVHVVVGEMLVGFVSTEGRFYSKVVREGESFVIPRGLMHFQYNVGRETAVGIAAYSSPNPGLLIIDFAVFKSTLAADVVEKITFLQQAEVKRLKGVFGGSG
uniref:Germin-like protein n=1 Tax=Eleusine coracana TaxID=4511 RepID=A0A1D8RJ13_ELECO|nr:oxalate oxidase [Eleusine coracana]